MKTYRINEIFYSLQGEGAFSGRAAIFVRFSGCNLKCPFCDTDFKAYKDMTAQEIVDSVKMLSKSCIFVVLTGGEPTLQVDRELIEAFHAEGFFISMETNGTKEIPIGIDWITFSPKNLFTSPAEPVIPSCDEIKVVFNGEHTVFPYSHIRAKYHYLQPCDTGDKAKNADILHRCIEFIKANPKWRLSLQTQKIINVR